MLVTFRELLEDAFLDPDRVDYVLLRQLYVASEAYRPWDVVEIVDEDDAPVPNPIERLHASIAAEDWEDATGLAEALIEAAPLAIPMRLAYAHVLDAIGDDWEASTQRAVANGLVRAILRSGDGKTQATAIKVLDERELHLALELLGTRSVRTAVDAEGEVWIATAECADGRTVYFDVTTPQQWLQGRE